MNEPTPHSDTSTSAPQSDCDKRSPAVVPDRAVCVAAGVDRFGEHVRLGGVAPNDCKVSAQETNDAMSVFESVTPFKGGPPFHIHHAQDEWFYIMEGVFDFQVGDERFQLRRGDSVFAPRKIAHTWACVSDTPGKMMIVFQPAGAMEAFFRELGKLDGPPSPEAAQRLFRAHGMEIVGPPLTIP